MFTGIIEFTGNIREIQKEKIGRRMKIFSQNKKAVSSLRAGDSIAVNGVCQTIEKRKKNEFSIFCLPDTLASTNFQNLQIHDVVNLETALTLQKKISGHIVQGHVEGKGEVVQIENNGSIYNILVRYRAPHIALKSSIALDGISLTVQEVLSDGIFRVQIIPETAKRTNIKHWKPGYQLNVETDYLAKIVYEKAIRNTV